MINSSISPTQKLAIAGRHVHDKYHQLLAILSSAADTNLASVFCRPIAYGQPDNAVDATLGTWIGATRDTWIADEVHADNLRSLSELNGLSEKRSANIALQGIVQSIQKLIVGHGQSATSDIKAVQSLLELILYIPSEQCVLYDGEQVRIIQWGEVESGKSLGETPLLQTMAARPLPAPPPVAMVKSKAANFIKKIGPINNNRKLEKVKRKAGAKTGLLTITLMWNTLDDLDIHVACPDGTDIYFGNKQSCGGRLDVDMNASNPKLDPIENVFWAQHPPAGVYKVYINNFCKRSKLAGGTPFEIFIDYASNIKTTTSTVTCDQGLLPVAELTVTDTDIKINLN